MSVLRLTIDGSTRVISHVRRNRRVDVRAHDGLVKVNLGSGLSTAPGWIHIDGSLNALCSTWPTAIQRVLYLLSGSKAQMSFDTYHSTLKAHTFIHHDLGYGIPLGDGSADYIFTSHFLEHLTKASGRNLLNECYRVLKKGGVLRILVPDLAYALQLYQKNEKERMLETFIYCGEENSAFSRHKYLYDFEMLREVLLDSGFVNVARKGYREGTIPDINLVDNRPEGTLFLEASKAREES